MLTLSTSSAALNMGLNLGKQYIENQFQTVMPGVSSYWDTLKFYFKVSNKYVVQKLKVRTSLFSTIHTRSCCSPSKQEHGDAVEPHTQMLRVT